MKQGIHDDIDINDYHENREIVSSTGIKHAKRSTRNFVHYVLYGTEQKLTFDFGNAFELALMDMVNGTNDFHKFVTVIPTQEFERAALLEKPDLKVPKLSKTYRDLQDNFLESQENQYLIPDVGPESYDHIKHMVYSCKQNPTIMKLLKGTSYQKSLVWKDPETEVLCKTRPDICMVKKNVVLDIKTTIDASPQGFAKQVAKLDYPIQAVMQVQGCIHSGLMETVDRYFWLAVEKSEPFNVGLYEMSQEDLLYFTDEYQFLLKRCAKALKRLSEFKSDADIYSVESYGENADNKFGIITLEIPLWYRNELT